MLGAHRLDSRFALTDMRLRRAPTRRMAAGALPAGRDLGYGMPIASGP